MKLRFDIIQGTDEWFDLRSKRMTGSHAQAISANGKGLKTYILQIVENLIVPREHFSNKDIERGNELEPLARSSYEFEKGVEVDEVGFIEDGEYVGTSPDGLIGEDGGLEIKARNNAKHLALLLGGAIESSTIWQIQFNLLVTNRKWWDFVSYNPNFKKSLFIKRIEPDLAAHEKIKKGIIDGEKMLIELLSNEDIKRELSK